ncbi:MAG: hypothetical protein ACRDRV_05245 [Pseudonocardiaceae bacterium]
MTVTTAAMAVLLACAPLADAAPAATGTVLSGFVTFYGAADNDPPGSAAIAYPGLHETAGGIGTYADPITFATRYHQTYPPGTRIYLPRLAKYAVMEDDCACDQPANHVDLWMGGVGHDQGVVACANRMTLAGNESIVKDPDPDRPVDLRPLYSSSTGCITRESAATH